MSSRSIRARQSLPEERAEMGESETGAAMPQLTGALTRLGEDNITNILLRLPGKSVLRCRAVCRALRTLTSDAGFLADHARLRPTDVVAYSYVFLPTPHAATRCYSDIALDAVPVSSDEAGRRQIIRYPKMRDWLLLASSSGVLLFKKNEEFYLLCNPTTRQWAELPRLPRVQRDSSILSVSDRGYAFYLHTPSGEYRLLCRHNLVTNGTWCILSAGAAAPRPVDMQAAEAAGTTQLVPCLRTSVAPHVALHGRLYWPPHQASVPGQTEIVVFDMSLETLTRMAGPPKTSRRTLMKLFDMDGMLVAADFGEMEHVGLWFLEDYGTARWELRHRVANFWYLDYGRPVQPRDLLSTAAAGDGEGNIMLGNDKGLVVYNLRRKTVKIVGSVATLRNDVLMSRHLFKESLVHQPGFVASSQCSVDMSLIQF